jgi:hypothetical protein
MSLLSNDIFLEITFCRFYNWEEILNAIDYN